MSRLSVTLPALVFILLGSLAAPPLLQAQLCFRGHPSPNCGGFAILELTTGTRLHQRTTAFDPYAGDNSFYLSWTAGYLHNVGQHSALGAAFEMTADDDGHRYGPTFRYRRWLGPAWSLDLAPGVL